MNRPAWLIYWSERNGYVTTRAEYAFNKAAHASFIGIALHALTSMSLELCLTIAALAYYAATFTPLGDRAHRQPFGSRAMLTHAAEKLAIGLFPAVIASRSVGWIAWWTILLTLIAVRDW